MGRTWSCLSVTWTGRVLLALIDGDFFHAAEEYEFADCGERFSIGWHFKPGRRLVFVNLLLQRGDLASEFLDLGRVDRARVDVAASNPDDQRHESRDA